MNMLERLREIVQVDVMSNADHDFMATHMPFKNLMLRNNGRDDSEPEDIDEEQAFRRLVGSLDNHHRMVMVRGLPGSGKSHLIRWFHTRISQESEEFKSKNQVVFIRRIDNTLRGAMQQLLDQGIVTDSNQAERFRGFISSVESSTPEELRKTIYYTFLIKIDTETQDTLYRAPERGLLLDFLKDDIIQRRLESPDGPIERFYELIAHPRQGFNAAEPKFTAQDFLSMSDLKLQVTNNSLPNTKLIFSEVTRLEEEASKLAQYLNTYSHSVIQTCARIAQGDAEKMLRQLRLDLKNRQQSLIMLIEDLTTFTGIDSELVKVLSIDCEGENNDLCNVTSVIGITDEHYRSYFRDNFQDRVTQMIDVNPAFSGDEEFLTQLSARYINAIQTPKDELIRWFENGFDAENIPIHAKKPDYPWDCVWIGSVEYPLFPFTRRSLLALHGRLSASRRTPRHFLGNVIKLQMEAWILSTGKKGQALFPNSTQQALGNNAVTFNTPPIMSKFENEMSATNENIKKAIRSILCLWGNGTLEIGKKEDHDTIGSIPFGFFRDLEYPIPSGTTKEPQKPPQPLPPTPSPPPVNQNYQHELQVLQDWFYQGAQLFNSEDVKGSIKEFLLDSIYWACEGVPAYIAARRLDNRAIYIEGQMQQTPSRGQALVVLDKNIDSYNLILALIHYRSNQKQWNFQNASYLQLRSIVWLENNRESLLERIRGGLPDITIDHLACSLWLEHLRLVVIGAILPEDDARTVLRKIYQTDSSYSMPSQHSNGEWKKLQERVNARITRKWLDDNKEFLVQVGNSRMGTPSTAGSTVMFARRDLIDQAFKRIDALDWNPMTITERIQREGSDFNVLQFDQMSEYYVLSTTLVRSEENRFRELSGEVSEKIGDQYDSATWIGTSVLLVNWLELFSSRYGEYFSTDARTRAEKLAEESRALENDMRIGNSLLDHGSDASKLIYFGQDPCGRIESAVYALQIVEDIALLAERNAIERLSQIPNRTDDFDKSMRRIVQNAAEIDSLMRQIGGT
jgi:hypothetical protein